MGVACFHDRHYRSSNVSSFGGEISVEAAGALAHFLWAHGWPANAGFGHRQGEGFYGAGRRRQRAIYGLVDFRSLVIY